MIKTKNSFFENTSPIATVQRSMDAKLAEDSDSDNTKLTQVIARIPLYAYAYLEATFTGDNALEMAGLAVQQYGEKQDSQNQIANRTVAPTVSGVTVDPRYQVPPVAQVAQIDDAIVPAEIAKLFPNGVLVEKQPTFSKTSGKPGPRYVLTDQSNGRQVSAWQNEDGTLGWGKVGPIFVPRQRG